jgi:hypothetical protein
LKNKFLLNCDEAGDSMLLLCRLLTTSFDDVTATPSGIGVDCLSPFRCPLLPKSEPLEPGPKSGVRWRGVSRVAGADILRSERSSVESKTPLKKQKGVEIKDV